MNIKRIAVTGGTGFVGRHFADLLRERGHEAVLISRRVPPEPRQGRVHAVGLDDAGALARAFTGCDSVAGQRLLLLPFQGAPRPGLLRAHPRGAPGGEPRDPGPGALLPRPPAGGDA